MHLNVVSIAYRYVPYEYCTIVGKQRIGLLTAEITTVIQEIK